MVVSGLFKMEEGKRTENQVTMVGVIHKPFVFNHELHGENFFKTELEILRKSGNSDYVPVIISERVADVEKLCVGQTVRIFGQFRSYNLFCEDTGKAKLILSVFPTEIEPLEDESLYGWWNDIEIDGFICKQPVFRKTPHGREIADVMVAVNRPYGKADYIPCVFWGRNARYVNDLPVGTKIKTSGRIQSRPYVKIIGEAREQRTAYEVSANTICELLSLGVV